MQKAFNLSPPPAGSGAGRETFDRIARRYDSLNHLFSLGLDYLWRKKAARKAEVDCSCRILDVAIGTADMALALRTETPAWILGLDISKPMLKIAREKIARKSGAVGIDLICGECENLPFKSEQFEVETMAFGIRNARDREATLQELFRVLKPRGQLVILEFSWPHSWLLQLVYGFYLFKIMPLIGGWISKNRPAYRYLAESIVEFPSKESFSSLLKHIGFRVESCQSLSFGIVCQYLARKI